MQAEEFSIQFEALTRYPPLRWQKRLFGQLAKGDIPSACSLPTGLGKTMVMAIWLLARAKNPALPRRLVYVVDRRTVVDQATDLARTLRDNAMQAGVEVPAISTLRGQFADNREWSKDPSRPAIIIGTVDLIGSALLFSGYRSSYKRRPLEAGLLGQDSLLVLDEAHLSKPFEKLLGGLAKFQQSRDREGAIAQAKPMCVLRMSATGSEGAAENRFKLENSDLSDPIINERFTAKKHLEIREVDDVIDSIAVEAGKMAADKPGSRIVIFVKSPKDVDAARKALLKKHPSRKTKIAQLTGTMRGLERDELVDTKKPLGLNDHERRVMQRFLKPDDDSSQGECFLISTSAGEVGFDLNADHMVCDAAPLDSMIQRLGRVNRRGKGDATILLYHEPIKTTDKDGKPHKVEGIEKSIATTLELLDGVSEVSPKNLAALKESVKWKEKYKDACSPEPAMVELTDILLNAWSMTSIREPMPGRPEVGPWLRGIADDLPQTTIAWRAELDESGFADLDLDEIEKWFDTHRILAHENLSVPTSFASKQLLARWSSFDETEQKKIGDHRVVIDRAGIKTILLKDFMNSLERDERQTKKTYDTIRSAELILPASFGGIERGNGMLDAEAPQVPKDEHKKSLEEQQIARTARLVAPDVADIAPDRQRLREAVTKDQDGESASRPIGGGAKPPNPAILRIELESDDDKTVRLVSYVPRPEKFAYGSGKQPLKQHVGAVRKAADDILSRIVLPDDIIRAARLAADYHDHGKNRERWQRTVNGQATPAGQDWIDATLGKSAGEMKRDPSCYRHEFGSLRELADAYHAGKLVDQAGTPMSEEVFDLAMHLIATHHGRGRPHFPKGGFDPDAEQQSEGVHTESIRRFARLQRKYGWWRLAWLENLLRCADALASAESMQTTPLNRKEASHE